METISEQLSEEYKNIYFIRGARNARYPNSHSLLIGDHLIDTGISRKILRKIKKQIKISTVLLSHWHEDHISGNSFLNLDTKFLCHQKDKPIIEDIEKMYPYYGIENSIAEDELRTVNDYLGITNTKIDGIIRNNDIINIGDDLKLKIIYTPGHTAGHCSFCEMRSKIAFFGDIDLTRFPYYGSIDADLLHFEESIELIKGLDIDIVVTGHREPIKGIKVIKEELDNYKKIIHKRDERIMSNLSEKTPMTPNDLKGKNLIYKKYVYENYDPVAGLLMIGKHFDKFLAKKLIIPSDNGFILS